MSKQKKALRAAVNSRLQPILRAFKAYFNPNVKRMYQKPDLERLDVTPM